ncbi:hypothetical protein [Mammaliicoccus sciuri]|uniref:Phage PVL protein n=1 Tax=Mammaliicoccus sciuri TaxID=1296 RepID=A0ABT7HVS3_MAMSC|nr:hypothetical protein [Mammaliicoccus sciuri]MDL0112324.1 hypothetical protein [Mammaliicoccus sciuri]MDL0116242.1 hypothetical protein [Mammaliicoccus sciuri]
MPTIKTKKEMNLGELLCWAIDNKEQASLKDFYSKNIGVKFNASGYPCIEFEKKFLPTYETFTVEIKEEITEDTVIPKMVCIGRKNQNETNIHYSRSIGQFLDNEDFNYYVLNDDDTLTLIWRDGKWVE